MMSHALTQRLAAVTVTALLSLGLAAAPAMAAAQRTPDLTATPTEIATDILMPWGVTFLPDGDALMAERQTGNVLRIGPGRPPEVVGRIPDMQLPNGDGGLLGIDLSPRFARDNLVYVYYTAATDSRIARFRLNSGRAPEVIFSTGTRGEGHSGGRLKFGPDGMLYATVGDGVVGARAQDLNSLNGKILRMTPEGRPAPGNPFRNSAVWSYGHRNPEGLAWDSRGRMYSAEFGEDAVDEINLIKPGRNYGWPMVEGTGDTQNGRLVNPLITFPTQEAGPSGIAISGNTLYMAGLTGQRLFTMPLIGGRIGEPTQHLVGTYGRLRTVEIAPDGALWLTTSNQPRQPREGDDRVLRFPTRR